MSRLDEVAALIAIPSVSRHESAIADVVARALRQAPHLDVERVGDNVVARTTGRHSRRLLVAGHVDTVPGDPTPQREGDRITGVGACDMKGSLAVMLELAVDPTARPVEVTWVFYAREEIARAESGLRELIELRPDLVSADVAVLAEPTGGSVEAGCQGSMRIGVTLRGRRAHTARPFMGVNAIHRAGALIQRVAGYLPRVAAVDGITFTEQLQVVKVEGGVAANVVPDEARVTLNHRVAPDRDRESAWASVLSFLSDVIDDGDDVVLEDWAPAAPPSLDSPDLARLVTLSGGNVRGKVGWTDVATFHESGIPAANFGAGDPTLAHHPDEAVSESELDDFATVLRQWLAG